MSPHATSHAAKPGLARWLAGASGVAVGVATALALPLGAEAAHIALREPAMAWLALLLGPLAWLGSGHLWDAPALQRFASLGLRCSALLCLVVALCDPVRVTTEQAPVEILVLRDRSESVSPDAALPGPVVAALRTATEAGAVVREVPFEGSAAGAVEGAIAATGADHEVRAVLATDGGQAASLGLHGTLDRLREVGIPVTYVPLTSRLDEGDVAVTRLELPRAPVPGTRAPVWVEVTDSRPPPAAGPRHADLVCTLTVAEEVAGTAPVGADGLAHFDGVKIPGPDPLPVAVRCGVRDGSTDALPQNDAILDILIPAHRPRVLVVDSAPHDARAFTDALGPAFDVTVRGPGGIPRGDEAWGSWDVVIVSDLPRVQRYARQNFSPRQMASADAWVRAGGGLIMVGGPRALGVGGYVGTRLEQRTLPAWLDAPRTQATPQLAIVLVLDRSGSMSGLKLQLAREAASATVESLARDDRIGIVSFDAKPEEVVSLQRAANRFRILDDISRISAGGGTHIRPALAQAFRMLRRTDAHFRHVILLTDGQSPREGIVQLVQSMAEADISVSTVAVGREADRVLLRDMAEAGGGRYHFTDSPRHIPRIFLSETREVRKRTATTGRTRPTVTARGGRAPFLRPIAEDLPPLDGFVQLRPKPRAEVLLREGAGRPLLVRWRRGRGRVAIFASDLKGIWSSSWLRSLAYPRFWRGLVADHVPVGRRAPAVTVFDEGDALRVQIVRQLDALVKGNPRVRLRAAQGGDEPVDLSAREVADGVWEASGAAPAEGAWLVEVHDDPDDPWSRPVHAAFVRPYPTSLSPQRLAEGRERLAALTKAGLLAPADPRLIAAPATQQRAKTKELWPAGLLAFAALWLGGLLLRRLPLGRARQAAWL